MRLFFVFALSCFLFLACSKKSPDYSCPESYVCKTPSMTDNSRSIDDGVPEKLQKGKALLNTAMRSLVTGKEVKLTDYKGKKLIVDFWSHCCGGCLDMFPALEKIKKEYDDDKKGVVVLSINIDDDEKGQVYARDRIAEYGVTFEVLMVTASLKASLSCVPLTVFIDENGKIIAETEGSKSYEEIKKAASLP